MQKILLEPLEQRCFNAGWGPALSGGTLVIWGAPRVANAIDVISPDGANVIVTVTPNGRAEHSGEYAAGIIKRIEIFGGRGADWIEVGNEAHPIAIPSIIRGGPGDDTIIGGEGHDRIICGVGSAIVDGNGGDDTIISTVGHPIIRLYSGDHTYITGGHGQVVDGNVVPGVNASSDLTPSNVRQAYAINEINFDGVAGDGLGETIAIIGRFNDPNALDDLHRFDADFGLPDPPSFQVLNQAGMTSPLPSDATVGAPHNGALEESIDVQWAHAIAPEASIDLVEANTNTDSDIDAAILTAARLPDVAVVSMSFGGAESLVESQRDNLFQTPRGHPGVTFLAASGDTGGETIYPAASPNVIAVGGTVLSVYANGTYLAESGWVNSGGGVSPVETDTFQTGGLTRRTTPDVAMVATDLPVVDSYDFPNAPVITAYGTSVACPMWAGLIAIADQGRVLAGKAPLDGPSQTLPALYSLPATDFHSITTIDGGSFNAGSPSTATGLGSPIADELVPDLVASSA